jgi:ATP-dependent Lon protease
VRQTDIPEELPILPISNAVLFPGMLLPLAISGEIWVRMVDEAALSSKMIGVFWRMQPGEAFDPLALAQTGTAALILRMLRMPDGSVQLLLQGQARIQIQQLLATEPYPLARVKMIRRSAAQVTGLALFCASGVSPAQPG